MTTPSKTVAAAQQLLADRELLELAAKAAGLDGFSWVSDPFFEGLERRNFECDGLELQSQTWNPLENDGDALRLAVRLGMLATYSGARFEMFQATYRQCLDGDMKPSEATRRAIVMVAAQAAQPAADLREAVADLRLTMGKYCECRAHLAEDCPGVCDTRCERRSAQ